MKKARTVTNAIERFHLRNAKSGCCHTHTHKAGQAAAPRNNVMADKEQSAPFSSANRRAVRYEMNPPFPPAPLFSCINIMQLWATEKLLMQRGNPYFCQLPHLKCNQSHSRGSWNLNQHQNSHHEGPDVLYCTGRAGKALISIADSIHSGRKVLFISKKRKKNVKVGEGKLKVCGYGAGRLFFFFFFFFHGSSKIIHPSVMKPRLDQKVGEGEKWSRTKHLERDKNSSLKVLTGTAGEQGRFVLLSRRET